MKQKWRQIDHRIALRGPIFDSELKIFQGGEAYLPWAAPALWWVAPNLKEKFKKKYLGPIAGSNNDIISLSGCMGWMQVALGISTLLLYVPVPVAAAHQERWSYPLQAP